MEIFFFFFLEKDVDDRVSKKSTNMSCCDMTNFFFPPLIKCVACSLEVHSSPFVYVVTACDVMCIHRIMHWARRIEQEIDRVFQHITGAQQLKGVSVQLSFYSIQVLLIIVLHKLNKKCSTVCKTAVNPLSLRAKQEHETRNNYSLLSETSVSFFFLSCRALKSQ